MNEKTDHDHEILNRIIILRNKKIMLDSDLASLYEVETKQLKRQVNRNIERFPEDFMFVLTKEELEFLRCQNGTSNLKGGTRYLPMAFTEQGVAMLSSVLKSPRAIQTKIHIIRVFYQLRRRLIETEELRNRMKLLEGRLDDQESDIGGVIALLENLISESAEETPRPRIGFKR